MDVQYIVRKGPGGKGGRSLHLISGYMYSVLRLSFVLKVRA